MWLEKLSQEISLLNLAENRAVVSARLGNLYWQTDQARARELFNQAGRELTAAQKEIDGQAQPGNMSVFTFNSARRQVLQLIVKNDAAGGFELFVESRPQLVTDALANRPLPDFGGISFSGENITPAQNLIRQENELEQTLALAVIATGPQKAIEILRRDDAETIVQNTYHLLKELRQKEPAVADDIARQIVGRLLTIDLAQATGAIRFINQLLADSLPENHSPEKFQIEPIDIRRLAEREAEFLIKSGRNSPGSNYEYILSTKPTLIKLVPERAAELNEIVIPPKSGAVSFSSANNHQKLIERGTVEQIMAEGERMAPETREFFYSSVASGITMTGDLARARELLAKNFTGQRLADLNNSLDQAYARQAIQKGDYAQAAEMIDQISPLLQYHTLVELAIAVYTKNPDEPEERERARIFLERAKQTLSPAPETREDFTRLDKIASAAALIEPTAGFRMLEVLIAKYVEIATANLLVESYQGRGGITAKSNELLIGGHRARFLTINFALKNFMAADSDRTRQLIDRIERADLRISLALAALESAANVGQVF